MIMNDKHMKYPTRRLRPGESQSCFVGMGECLINASYVRHLATPRSSPENHSGLNLWTNARTAVNPLPTPESIAVMRTKARGDFRYALNVP